MHFFQVIYQMTRFGLHIWEHLHMLTNSPILVIQTQICEIKFRSLWVTQIVPIFQQHRQ